MEGVLVKLQLLSGEEQVSCCERVLNDVIAGELISAAVLIGGNNLCD